MEQDAKHTDWQEIEDNMVSQWYFVSKIMCTLIPKTFPYFTFAGIVEEIRKDPNFKSKDGEPQQ